MLDFAEAERRLHAIDERRHQPSIERFRSLVTNELGGERPLGPEHNHAPGAVQLAFEHGPEFLSAEDVVIPEDRPAARLQGRRDNTRAVLIVAGITQKDVGHVVSPTGADYGTAR